MIMENLSRDDQNWCNAILHAIEEKNYDIFDFLMEIHSFDNKKLYKMKKYVMFKLFVDEKTEELKYFLDKVYDPEKTRLEDEFFLKVSDDGVHNPCYVTMFNNFHHKLRKSTIPKVIKKILKCNNFEIFEKLMSNQAVRSLIQTLKFDNGDNILHIANAKQIAYLRETGLVTVELANEKNENDGSPILVHISNESVECVKELISTGMISPYTFVNESGDLVEASFIGKDIDMVQLILDNFINEKHLIEACTKFGLNFIQIACMANVEKWYDTLVCILDRAYVSKEFVSSLKFEEITDDLIEWYKNSSHFKEEDFSEYQNDSENDSTFFNKDAVAYVKSHEKYLPQVEEEKCENENYDYGDEEDNIETYDVDETEYTLVNNFNNVISTSENPNLKAEAEIPTKAKSTTIELSELEKLRDQHVSNIKSYNTMIWNLESQNKELIVKISELNETIENYKKCLQDIH